MSAILQRPATLTPKTVSILLVVLSVLILLSQIISLSTSWYNIVASGLGIVAGQIEFGLLAQCSRLLIISVCNPYSALTGTGGQQAAALSSGGGAAFAFGFFALLAALAGLIFWAIRLRSSSALSGMPTIVPKIWGRCMMAIPVLCFFSWVSWVGGFANYVNSSSSSGQPLPVVGGAGLAFSLISNLLGLVAVLLNIWNSDQILGGSSASSGSQTQPAPTPQ